MTMTMVTETGMLLAILIVHEIIPAVQVAAVDPAHQDWAASGAQAVHVVGTMHHDVAWPAVPKRCSVLAHVAAAGNDVVRFLRSVRMRRVRVVRPDPHEANCCGTAWAAVPSDRVGSSSANHDGRGVCFATGVRRYPLWRPVVEPVQAVRAATHMGRLSHPLFHACKPTHASANGLCKSSQKSSLKIGTL